MDEFNRRRLSIEDTQFHDIPDGDILLDFTNCKNYWELHEVLKDAFGLPNYYGHNADALWDCLRDFFDEERKVIVKGIPSFENKEDYMIDGLRKIIEVFEDVHNDNPDMTFEYPELKKP